MYPIAPLPPGMLQCRFCGFVGHPHVTTKVSVVGWIVFTVLLIFCLPLFWIGLLIKNTKSTCPSCLR